MIVDVEQSFLEQFSYFSLVLWRHVFDEQEECLGGVVSLILVVNGNVLNYLLHV